MRNDPLGESRLSRRIRATSAESEHLPMPVTRTWGTVYAHLPTLAMLLVSTGMIFQRNSSYMWLSSAPVIAVAPVMKTSRRLWNLSTPFTIDTMIDSKLQLIRCGKPGPGVPSPQSTIVVPRRTRFLGGLKVCIGPRSDYMKQTIEAQMQIAGCLAGSKVPQAYPW